MLDFDDLEGKDVRGLLRPGFGGQAPGTQSREAAAALDVDGLPRPLERIRRKMQVLVLHGRQSNENLVNFQLSGLKQALGKDVELRFLEGEVVWKYVEGVDNHDADPMTVSLAKGRDFKVWFSHTTDDPRERIDFFKQQDPSVKVTYQGAERAAEQLLRCVEADPVDVIVALFEGTIVVHLAIARLLQERRRVPWRLSVFFGTMCVRDDALSLPLMNSAVLHPTVHIFGRSDEYWFYQRTAAGRRPPGDYYESPIIIEHGEGHQLPSPGAAASKAIYERIALEMRYRCGLEPLLGAPPPRPRRPPRPSSILLKDLNTMAPRKLRVLALCGGHSCKAVIKFQTTQLRNALGKDLAEWTYIEGTKDWTYFDGEPIVSEMEEKIAAGAQLKNWYMDTCHESEGKTDRLNRDKQFDPSVRVEYHDVQGVLEHWKDFIFREGPFDVLVGFSQGCILLHLLIAHLRRESPGGRERFAERWQHSRNTSEDMPWRCSLFFCGLHVRDRDFAHLFETPSPHPTIHVFGKSDEYYEYARDGFGCKPQEEYYVDPLVLVHEQGHEFPSAMPRARQIYEKVSLEVWRLCGGRPGAAG